MRYLFIALGSLILLYMLVISSFTGTFLGQIVLIIIGLPLLLYGILYKKFNTKFRKLRNIFAAVYAIIILFVMVCMVLITSAPRIDKTDNKDAIIVLGAAFDGNEPGEIMKNRLDLAAEYLEAHPGALCMLSGGKNTGEGVSEAKMMENYLVQKYNIDPNRTLLEDNSHTTSENLQYCQLILNDIIEGTPKIAFLTSDFHIYRTSLIARELGGNLSGLAAPTKWYLAPVMYLRECAVIPYYWLTKTEPLDKKKFKIYKLFQMPTT